MEFHTVKRLGYVRIDKCLLESASVPVGTSILLCRRTRMNSGVVVARAHTAATPACPY